MEEEKTECLQTDEEKSQQQTATAETGDAEPKTDDEKLNTDPEETTGDTQTETADTGDSKPETEAGDNVKEQDSKLERKYSSDSFISASSHSSKKG